MDSLHGKKLHYAVVEVVVMDPFLAGACDARPTLDESDCPNAPLVAMGMGKESANKDLPRHCSPTPSRSEHSQRNASEVLLAQRFEAVKGERTLNPGASTRRAGSIERTLNPERRRVERAR